jgi:hypothetical protein
LVGQLKGLPLVEEMAIIEVSAPALALGIQVSKKDSGGERYQARVLR